MDTSGATATAASVEYGKTAYVNGVKITGTKQAERYKFVDSIPFDSDVGTFQVRFENVTKDDIKKMYIKVEGVDIHILWSDDEAMDIEQYNKDYYVPLAAADTTNPSCLVQAGAGNYDLEFSFSFREPDEVAGTTDCWTELVVTSSMGNFYDIYAMYLVKK